MSMNYTDISAAVDPQQDMSRPARLQTKKSIVEGGPRKGGAVVNIWSGRRTGDRGDKPRERQRSGFRCHPALDVGRTRGSQGHVNTFCLYFARGMCTQGAQCPYLHRLPTQADEAALCKDHSRDIFGREKVTDRMDNRKGAGSYERDMTTLYCHYGGAGHYTVEQLKKLLVDNFQPWGPVASLYIVTTKTIAFVRYHWRASAEFAREAMDNQGLEGSTAGEVLSLRWANEDPNPVSVTAKRVRAEDAMEDAAMAAWDALPPEEKRARLAALRLGEGRKVSAVATAYPDTSAQFEASAAAAGGGGGAAAGASSSGVAEAYPDTEAQYSAAAAAGEQAPQQYTEIPLEAWQQYNQQQYYQEYYQQQAYYQQGAWDPAAAAAGPGGAADQVAAAAGAGADELRIPIPSLGGATGQSSKEAPAAPAAGPQEGAAAQKAEPADPLALLAGYGSDDDDDDNSSQGGSDA